MSAWVLPDHIADVLPSEARHVEGLRRFFLDTARSYGYELVIPPLIEHLDSLLTGTGGALDLQTFKLVDQLSGRSLGLRADTTPQVARIDAHLLNRQSVARLCYCGPVLHAVPDHAHATREPLQFGAEIYGHEGIDANLEIIELAMECAAQACPLSQMNVDLADIRILDALLSQESLDDDRLAAIHLSLAAKDVSELAKLTRSFSVVVRNAILALPQLYGDQSVLQDARKFLGGIGAASHALTELEWLGSQLSGAQVTFDLADLRGYAYYSGLRFAVYVPGASDALVRGGRYDAVGAVFGRNRPAAGFSLDVKQAATLLPILPSPSAVLAPFDDSPQLKSAIALLRKKGYVVIQSLQDQCNKFDGFCCDQELVQVDGQWIVCARSETLSH